MWWRERSWYGPQAFSECEHKSTSIPVGTKKSDTWKDAFHFLLCGGTYKCITGLVCAQMCTQTLWQVKYKRRMRISLYYKRIPGVVMFFGVCHRWWWTGGVSPFLLSRTLLTTNPFLFFQIDGIFSCSVFACPADFCISANTYTDFMVPFHVRSSIQLTRDNFPCKICFVGKCNVYQVGLIV